MKEVEAIFTERIKRTENVVSFRSAPREKLEFLPGQFLQVIFDRKNRDNRSLNKYLSFSSAPGKEYIEVTKRISGSQFSKKLLELKEGDRILVKAPMGSCTFKEEYKKIAFLIGGIGITPVISIIEHIAENKISADLCLLYSNKTEDAIAFKNELDAWARNNSNIKVVYAVDDCKPKDKSCFFDKIDKQLILESVPDYQDRVFYIFGPPAMVNSLKKICLDIGCPKESVKTEQFLGY